MSASKNKRLRMEAKDNVNEAAVKAAAEEEKKKRKYKTTVTIIAIVLAVFVLVVAVLSSSLLYNKLTSVKIGNEKFSASEYDFYYNVVYGQYYSNIVNSYGEEYASYLMPDEATIKSEALSMMQSTVVLHEKAEAAGYEMDEAGRQIVDNYISAAQSGAEQANFGTNVSAYLAAYYGKGMNEKIYKDVVEYYVYASSYGSEVYNSYDFSADELNAYYEENADTYDALVYNLFQFSSSDYEDAAAEAEAFKEELEGGADFAELAVKYAADDDKATYADGDNITYTVQASALSSEFSDWMLEERTAGDATVVTTDTSSFVLQYLSRDKNEYYPVSFRHILVNVEDLNKEDFASDEAYEKAVQDADDLAKETAELYYKQWQSSATEENFAAMADEYSADSSEGGLFTDVYKGKMVSSINNWIFDEARQPGDTEIVKSTYGYHIMYFVGTGDTLYKDTLAKSGLGQSTYNAWVEETISDYPISTTAVMKIIGK